MNNFCIVLVFLMSAASGFAVPLSLPAVFSDHMVLQRERPVPVWGTADVGSEVVVEFAGQKKTATVGDNGKWTVTLDPLLASFEPQVLTVHSRPVAAHVSFSNVLVGEVWFCCGQSNMEMVMKSTENAAAATAAADHPYLRLFKSPRLAAREPAEQIDAQWKVCSPVSAKYFSAVAYYFGRKLQQDLNVPVGLLLSAWGSTRIEPWIPPCGFRSVDSLVDIYRQTQPLPELSNDPKKDRQIPSAAYNGMIAAHIPYAIRGAIWYQGEANRRDGRLYIDKTRALLNGWYERWGYAFPFYFVQIAPYQYGTDNPTELPLFWEAQSEIVKTVPNTGMAVVSDCTTLNDIHPPNKESPGVRLALLAEAKTYGMDVVGTGPIFQSLEKQAGSMKVHFDSAVGLSTRDGEKPDWFEVAGEDGVFEPAEAEIFGPSVVVCSQEVPEPIAVRFAWHKLATPNLMNGAGLPASAFRAKLDPGR